jgi:hypothetical protein
MALAGIPIPETQCIGDSLDTINSAFQTLDAASGVSKITAGSNVTISPAGGTGNVTINAVVPDAGATVSVQDTPPSGASAGDLWFDSSSGVTSVYYDSTWVDVGGGDSGTSAGSVNGIVECDGAGNFSAAVAGTDYATGVQGAKAWAVLNGSNPPNTVINSYNISSITVVGDFYRISFSSPMLNANYSVLISSTVVGVGWGMPVYHYANRTINSFDVAVGDSDNPSTYYASANFSVAVFGN